MRKENPYGNGEIVRQKMMNKPAVSVGDKIHELIGTHEPKINRYMQLTLIKTLCNVLEEAIEEIDEPEITTQFTKLTETIDKLQKEAWETKL
jgi:hypothetical protein